MDRSIERRRSPRSAAGDVSWLAMPVTWQVQLLDISLGGVAFVSPYAIEIGRTVSLRAMLGPEAMNTQVRVYWSRQRTAGVLGAPDFEIGAVFLSLEEASRRALSSFLGLSPHEE